jgi:hypothetical protein
MTLTHTHILCISHRSASLLCSHFVAPVFALLPFPLSGSVTTWNHSGGSVAGTAMASILQLQTQLAHGVSPIGIKTNAAKNTGSQTSSAASSASSATSLEVVRCCRCQRSLSFDRTSSPTFHGIVQFGLNSYYCRRCAAMVGFKE